jgi:hypothetical protein
MIKYSLVFLIVIIYSCSSKHPAKDSTTGDTTTGTGANKPEFTFSSAMKCEQTRLSDQFDMIIDVERYSDTIKIWDSCALKILIRDKLTKAYSDSIVLSSVYFAGELFANCDSLTSYSTKFNADREIIGNMFGDIVVADVNFDKKDDIAVIHDAGGNSEPLYRYFIQSGEKKFSVDNFLTDSVTYFPHVIDKAKGRLITYAQAGACCVGRNTYQFDKSTKEWRHTEHKLFGQDSTRFSVAPANPGK